MIVSKIIKCIRESTGYNQEEFASIIGVSRLAVTRWENNKTIPSKIAQTMIYEFALKHGVKLYDFIAQQFPPSELDGNKLTLYHGSKAGITGEIGPFSRDRCDFGKGFYMGTEIHQPLTLICTHPQSVLYLVELNLDNLKVVNVTTDINWALLIAYCRGRLEKIKDTPLYNKYKLMLKDSDIVVGSIANDRMFYVLDRFFDGAITDLGLVESLTAVRLGLQYVALTDKACQQIKILKSYRLSEIERLCLNDMSDVNRQQGIDVANEICKNYRRAGRFFDEILKGTQE